MNDDTRLMRAILVSSNAATVRAIVAPLVNDDDAYVNAQILRLTRAYVLPTITVVD